MTGAVHYMAEDPARDHAWVYPREIADPHHQSTGCMLVEVDPGGVLAEVYEIDAIRGEDDLVATLARVPGTRIYLATIDGLGDFGFEVTDDRPARYGGALPCGPTRDLMAIRPVDQERLEIACRLHDLTFIGRALHPDN